MKRDFDIIIIGGGHAGCEAALSTSRLGSRTLLITLDKQKIGLMSCNPAIGGVGKGQLVRELDAIGGEMGKAIDATLIQFRMLNSSKGYAARSSRAQADRKDYNDYMRNKVSEELDVLEDEAIDLIVKNGRVNGVQTKNSGEISSKAVVITTGTFLNGIIHIGLRHKAGGRIDEDASEKLSRSLAKLGFKMMSLKTGTTPRLDGRTIDFSNLTRQDGDRYIIPFSFWTKKIERPLKPCFLTRTNERTHKIIRESLHRSPLYSGKIKSTGARYCPSIEDKIVKFSDRTTHVVFLEPEGLETNDYYPNGISMSLPLKVQEKIVRSVQGLERAKIVRPGYGIEYNIVDPTELKATLETKKIENLFLAGQINGTTGYEEAASLGLIAGINAFRKITKKDPLILGRSEAYIGVLIDDLVTKGTREPYRMFTSRVEYRMTVREDNAAKRLGKIGYAIGLLPGKKFKEIEKREKSAEAIKKRLKTTKITPKKEINDLLQGRLQSPVSIPTTLANLLKRPNLSLDDIMKISGWKEKIPYFEKTQAEVDIKYEGYIKRELSSIAKFKKIEKVLIPKNFDYSGISGLSSEVKEKLSSLRPRSLGQASRVSGVTPAAITILMVKLHAGEKV